LLPTYVYEKKHETKCEIIINVNRLRHIKTLNRKKTTSAVRRHSTLSEVTLDSNSHHHQNDRIAYKTD